jgi:hypothetical protein
MDNDVADLRMDRLDRIDYMVAMIAEMRAMAQRNGMPTLSYFLDMALAEAEEIRFAERNYRVATSDTRFPE